MNYFQDAPDWIPLELDQDLFRDIKKCHPYLATGRRTPEGMDGFFFVDSQGWLILVDLPTHMVKVVRREEMHVLNYNDKYNFFMHGEEKIYFKNQLLIKNNKKFYSIVPKRQEFLMDILFKIQFIRNRIYSPY